MTCHRLAHAAPATYTSLICLIIGTVAAFAAAGSHGRRTLGVARDTWVETLSWQPRVFMFHDLLTDDECQHLIDLGKPHLEKFLLYNTTTHEMYPHSDRTGTGYFLPRGQDGRVRRIERHIADVTFIPVDHGQGLHVLNYQPGQVFGPHRDQPHYSASQNMRVATLLVYLSDPPPGGGGETVFPAAVDITPANASCGASGLVVRPKKGSAIMFYSLHPNSTVDAASIHQACPPIGGEKWAATKIMWKHCFDYAPPASPGHRPSLRTQTEQYR